MVEGWNCPKCNNVYSPNTAECLKCNYNQESGTDGAVCFPYIQIYYCECSGYVNYDTAGNCLKCGKPNGNIPYTITIATGGVFNGNE